MRTNIRLDQLRLATVAVVIGLLAVASPVFASGADEQAELIQRLLNRIEQLEKKVEALESGKTVPAISVAPADSVVIQQLDQKVRILERQAELDKEADTEKAKAAPTVALGANGLVIRSGDSNFLMNVHGYAQVDGRFYLDNPSAANDTFLLRRVRPIIEGTVADRFDYRLMLDVGSGTVSGSSAGNVSILDDAYVNARLWPQVQIQVGKYKSPVGLERLQSTAELLFIETGFATQLTPNYDLGAEVHNSLFNSPLNYAIGIFNGATDAGSDDVDIGDQGKDVVGRLFAQPFLHSDHAALRKLGFGVAGSIGSHQGALPTYKTPGQQAFFSYTNKVTASGQQYRIDPQFYYYWGPFGLIGEYVISSQEIKSTATKIPTHMRLNNEAWQLEGSCFLTGDENSFRYTSKNGFNPTHALNLRGNGWGALELVARVGQLSLDKRAFPNYATSTSAQEATSWGIGLNWYLNRNVRLYLDYESTHFKGGNKAAGSLTANGEHVLLSQIQFEF